MTYRGQVRNGVVVFDGSAPLADGTLVDVAPADTAAATPAGAGAEPTWAEVLKEVIGKAEGLPSDLARNHNHYLHGSPKR
ncbi:MAG: hypothetical protein AVDCRST_MAG64-2754 [uncultured Phycisphaerae bacterium]|uniref:Uncharacterized protein n=1 Tax=uncultured Phycisphaerae bacterium TaxID=904963 RepID=A0A6J4PT75_9BACT|nr:MAG: hypothetical protein AVDCRST_MAG64-2754 [uncultured Phycisphaerae bacterium]